MTLRRLLFWLHLAVGVTVGLVVAFLAVTGSILAFQPQIVAWAERDARIAAPQTQSCVAPSAVLGNAAAFERGQPTGFALYSDSHRPAEVAFRDGAVALVDGCSGRVIGRGANGLRGFFQATRELHQQAALSGVRHETLRAVKNAAVLGFLFLILSGLVLWVPRRLTWQHLRPVVFFRGNLKGRAREWSWHNVFGFWMALPLAAIVVSGIIMAYPWANALLFRAAGSTLPPPRAPERSEGDARRQKPTDAAQFVSLDAAIQAARAHDGEWKILTLRLPAAKDPNVTFTLDAGDGGRPQLRGQLVISRKDGQVVRWEPFAAGSRSRQWRAYVRFLHTGEIFGLVGRSVAVLASLSALMLVWTGFSLALRRLAAWRKNRSARGRELGRSVPQGEVQSAGR